MGPPLCHYETNLRPKIFTYNITHTHTRSLQKYVNKYFNGNRLVLNIFTWLRQINKFLQTSHVINLVYILIAKKYAVYPQFLFKNKLKWRSYTEIIHRCYKAEKNAFHVTIIYPCSIKKKIHTIQFSNSFLNRFSRRFHI